MHYPFLLARVQSLPPTRDGDIRWEWVYRQAPWQGSPLPHSASCSWTGRKNIVKMAFLPKVVYRYNTVSIKTDTILHGNRKIILNSIWKLKIPRIANTTGSINISYFKVYHKVITIKTTWHWHKIRHTDQQEGTMVHNPYCYPTWQTSQQDTGENTSSTNAAAQIG